MNNRGEMTMKKLKELLRIFGVFFKIGAFTFGGGYAMISVIEDELISRRKWITESDLSDYVAVAESTPGPIAINCATGIGYQRAGFLGAVFATLGVIAPSLIIIVAIAAVLGRYWHLPIVVNAFKGIAVAVGFVILRAGLRMYKKMPKKAVPLALFGISAAVLLATSVFSVSFSSVYLILLGAAVGTISALWLKKKGGEE